MMDRGLPIVATLALILFTVELAASQERTTDQVAVTVSILRDQVVAVTAGEGLVSVGLTSDDRLLGIEARGLNALVVTSTRLLGFSAQVQRWSEQRLNLNEQVLDDEHFIRQCEDIDREREQMFFDSLDKVPRGLCVCVFDGTDRMQHMFWRHLDEQHPARPVEALPRHRHAIEDLYQHEQITQRVYVKAKLLLSLFPSS